MGSLTLSERQIRWQPDAHLRGVRAFFFFFFVPQSPDFESDSFREFCSACYRLRAFKPTLTLAGLQVLLTVAASAEAMTYDQVAAAVGQGYKTTTIHAALLSDGRGSQPGLKLLKRVEGRNRKEKRLVLSRTGRAVAQIFVGHGSSEAACKWDQERASRQLKGRILPALSLAVSGAPNCNITTFAVFLFIVQHGERFGHYGEPASTIATALCISNLPRNLIRLSEGLPGSPGLGLIEIRRTRKDRRLALPALSANGLRLAVHIAAALLNQSPGPVRRAKEEKLKAAASPEDIKHFDDSDFDWFDIDDIDWGPKDNKS